MEKERSRLLDLIDGYEVPPEHRNEKGEPITGKSFFSRSFTGSLTGKRGLSSNAFFDAVKSLVRRLLYTSARVYGISLLTFGALVTVISLTFPYFDLADGTRSAIITGLVMALLGTVFMFSESPIGNFVEDFFLTDYLLFEFLCIKRMQKSGDRGKGLSPTFGILLGILFAAISALTHPIKVLLAVVLLLFVVLSFASPEFSFLLTVFVLPYTEFVADTTVVLASLLIITFLSFLRKVISGKRVYVFEKYDLLIGAMIIFVLISGIFIKGMESFRNSMRLVLGALGYIMASNLVTNRRLADRVQTAVMLSSLPASVFVTVKYIIGAADGNYRYVGEGFYSSHVFGAFITVALLFTASLFRETKRTAERVAYACALTVQLAALVCSASFIAAIALVFGVAAYFILKSRRFSAPMLAALVLLAYVPLLLPEKLLSSDAVTFIFGENLNDMLSLWRASAKMFSAHPFSGIGMGAEAFSEEIAGYGFTAESSSNLFLEIACEAGVFAFLFFAGVLLTSLRHRATYRPYIRSSQVKVASYFSAVALVCLIICGTVSYIWEHTAVCYLFWCVFGLGSATMRIAKRENDDKIIYYNDVVSSESSDIDVQIDGFSPIK